MKTFKSKAELVQITKGRKIGVWCNAGFIEVTKKALFKVIQPKCRGSYEHNTSYTILLQFS